MPACRKGWLSVAPVPIKGMTGTPGHISVVTFSIFDMTSGLRGDDWRCGGGAARFGLFAPTIVTPIFGSASTRSSAACVSAGVSCGSIRQLTLARAVCGSALLAWPPSSRVATQVVRITAL